MRFRAPSARRPLLQASGDAGFALVIVLGLIVLLAAVSAIVVGSVKAHIRAATGYVARSHAQVVAESGVAAASADLRRNWAKNVSRASVSTTIDPIVCSLGSGESLAIRVFGAGGRIDLNAAPPALFEALLAGLGVEAGAARELAGSIDAFRVERSAAAAAQGNKVDPPPLPFETEEAIGQVAGITPQLARAILPYVTVHSGQRGVDPKAADPRLLALIKSGQTSDLSQFLDSFSPQQTFIISVVAHTSDGGVNGQEAVVRLSRDKRFPRGLEIRSWRPAVFDEAMIPPLQADAIPCTTDELFSIH